ncbi:MAG: MBL fold metallo-hydrolase [Caldilineaceae bacterium]|nr:MBL fold metallo-hydrolase [Caldilineaceae bacterium]HRJ43104.1 MBL fold metallo-hydrolase [Caldilineaceae bacterium]
MPLTLITRQVGPWGMNTYALICPETGESVLIDPGADPDTLAEMLGNSTPTAILLTHTHGDHIGALDEMRQRLGVPVLAHPGPHVNDFAPQAARHLVTGDRVQVGNYSLGVQEAPGHCADQICFVLEDDYRVIVGDTIFAGGPGRTWSSEGFRTTLHTLQNVVLPWQDGMVCYPGHGPSFRLGDKRAAIEGFVAKDHGDFHGDATWEM